MRLTAKTYKVKGIKRHEEVHAHVDRPQAGTVWVIAYEMDEKGEAIRGVQVPLAPSEAREFGVNLQALAEYALPK